MSVGFHWCERENNLHEGPLEVWKDTRSVSAICRWVILLILRHSIDVNQCHCAVIIMSQPEIPPPHTHTHTHTPTHPHRTPTPPHSRGSKVMLPSSRALDGNKIDFIRLFSLLVNLTSYVCFNCWLICILTFWLINLYPSCPLICNLTFLIY